jgi:hypothetical protein
MGEVDFDVQDHRHRLKQLTDRGDAKLLENRDGLACPACREAFDRLYSTRRAATTFPENDGSRFCLVRGETYVHFRH